MNKDAPAFPIPLNAMDTWDADKYGNPNGITIRDYFAAKALQGLLARGERDRVVIDAWSLADRMIKERNA